LNKDQGTTLIIVTHDRELAARCDRIIELKSGKLFSDEKMVSADTIAQMDSVS
jgi:putative ABC transport system ATP-binding protein